jgi:hypothetical protein
MMQACPNKPEGLVVKTHPAAREVSQIDLIDS